MRRVTTWAMMIAVAVMVFDSSAGDVAVTDMTALRPNPGTLVITPSDETGQVKQENFSTNTSLASGITVAQQVWNMASLCKAYSKPMSADQEVYNNLMYLYLTMEEDYSKYSDIRDTVFQFDHTGLTIEMRNFVSQFVAFLEDVGKVERGMGDIQSDMERERSDSSAAAGFKGGFEGAATLSQFDRSDGEGLGVGAYLATGLIVGLIEANKADAQIKEKYERILRERREREKGIYMQFKQEFNKLRNGDVFKSFDRDRLLPENVVSIISGSPEDGETALRLIQCRVPDLTSIILNPFSGMESMTKRHLIAGISNYPQSLMIERKSDVSSYYVYLSFMALQEGLESKTNLDTISYAEFAVAASNSIALVTEAIKQDCCNHEAYFLRSMFKVRCGEFRGALVDIDKAISINAKNEYWYGKACVLSDAFKDAQGAKVAIREAFRNGFCNIKKLKEDKDLELLKDDPEFVEMIKVKYSWWYKPGLFFSEIFIKNESCFPLTDVQLVSTTSGWNWTLPRGYRIRIEPGETFSEDWYNNPPSYVNASATITCEQQQEK